jgi:mono/diheme cytochrome c family protein
MRKVPRLVAGSLLLLLALFAVAVALLNHRDEPEIVADAPDTLQITLAMVERGAYLARVGNCAACHTARGGAPYAGGQGIATPFGTVYASNLTPDPTHGLGRWTSTLFWRAMHNGRSSDGRLLYPAFPYPNFTQVTREDSDALYAYLRSLPPVAQANHPHTLRFPYRFQAALAVWRALFFDPGVYQPEPAKGPEWNRGSYLVRGLSHCNACHASRNLLGATSDALELTGGLIPMQNWYAPALTSPVEGGVADWDTAQIVGLLKDGVSPRGSVMGPMAEVIYRSTQYMSEPDLRAMAVFLKDLPQHRPPPPDRPPFRDPSMTLRGAKLYDTHCAQCHGKHGEGAPGAYPALAGNRAVTMPQTANLVRVVVSGGYLPSTSGNPRPYGMPPFSQVLDDPDIAAVLTYIRGAWGNNAEQVVPIDVLRYR